MTALVIRKALEIAGEAARRKCDTPDCCMTTLACPVSPCMCAREIAGAAVVAFLRALPEGSRADCHPIRMHAVQLADEVERVVGGGT